MYLYYYLSNLGTSSWDSFQERPPSVWNIDQDISVLLRSWASRQTVILNKFNQWKSTSSSGTEWAHTVFPPLFPLLKQRLDFLLPFFINTPSFVFSWMFLQVLEGWISLKMLITSQELSWLLISWNTLKLYHLCFGLTEPECALALSNEGQKSHSSASFEYIHTVHCMRGMKTLYVGSSIGPSHWTPAVNS